MSKKTLKQSAYALVILLPLYLFFTRSNTMAPFKSTVVGLMSTPLRLISFPLKEMKKILYYHRTFEEYRRVKRELDRLKTRVIAFEEVQKENSRLENLLQLKRKMVFSSVTARVIGRDPSRWDATLLIDKGSEDRVSVGLPVINAEGVVGRIAEVGEHTSKIMLLTDPRFSVAGLIRESHESGIVSGTLEGLCRIRYLKPEAKVQKGDMVITSKLSTSFPENLVIGQVIRIENNVRGPVPYCYIQPAVTFSQIEEVLVILDENAKE